MYLCILLCNHVHFLFSIVLFVDINSYYFFDNKHSIMHPMTILLVFIILHLSSV